MNNFEIFLFIACVLSYIIYLDVLTVENAEKAQRLSNAIMPINGDLTKSEWLKYAIETRKNMVAGTLSVATGLVLGIAKVII